MKHTPRSARREEYARANAAWLAAKAEEEGVEPLPGGVYRRILSSGPSGGRQPSARSIVTVHYTGRTVDGRTFDTSVGSTPLAIRLTDVIDGWRIALPHMHVGDRWELFIPAALGYGRFAQPGIPAHSVLVFEVELLGVG